MQAIAILDWVSPQDWAKAFCELRMEFHRKHACGLVFSTQHGVDFFHNVLSLLDGNKWTEQGALGDNFRLLYKLNTPYE